MALVTPSNKGMMIAFTFLEQTFFGWVSDRQQDHEPTLRSVLILVIGPVRVCRFHPARRPSA